MKLLFILLTLFSLNTYAKGEGCTGFYAADLEDIFTGKATQFADTAVLEFGTTTKDEFFGLSIGADNGKFFDLELRSFQVEGLIYLEETYINSSVSLFSTANLVGKLEFPLDVYGSERGAVYLVFLCVR